VFKNNHNFKSDANLFSPFPDVLDLLIVLTLSLRERSPNGEEELRPNPKKILHFHFFFCIFNSVLH